MGKPRWYRWDLVFWGDVLVWSNLRSCSQMFNNCLCDRLGACVDMKLFINMFDMREDSVLRDKEPIGDLLLRKTLDHEAKDLRFSWAEVVPGLGG